MFLYYVPAPVLNSYGELAERPRAQGESPCVRKVRAPQGKDNG